MIKRKNILPFITAACLALSACTAEPAESVSGESTQTTAETTAPISTAPALLDPDGAAKRLTGGVIADVGEYENKCTVTVDGAVGQAEINGDGAVYENGNIVITSGGEYTLSGTLPDGMIYIEAPDEYIRLVLDGLHVTNSKGAALYCYKGEVLTVKLADGSENTLADSEDYTYEGANESASDNQPDSAFFSKADIIFTGGGSLSVTGNFGGGIGCKDAIVFEGGNVSVTAEETAVMGKDSVSVTGGALDLQSGGDGIKTNNDEIGDVLISGGSVKISSKDSGVIADGTFCMTGGELDVVSDNNGIKGCAMIAVTGGAVSVDAAGDGMKTDLENEGDIALSGGSIAIKAKEDGVQADRTLEITGGAVSITTSGSGEDSSKGIKCDGAMNISNAALTLDTADHAVHSEGALTIDSGALDIRSSGGKGISSHGNLTVNGGRIVVSEATEGIESKSLFTVNGGEISITASEDGINTGSSDSGETADGHDVSITGGYVYVNAAGDGIDSNGSISISGGTVIVCGPTSSANGILDCGEKDGKITVTGGFLAAMGTVGMMSTPESGYVGSRNLGGNAGDEMCVTDADGKVVAAVKLPKKADAVMISNNGSGDGLSLYIGGSYSGEYNSDGYAAGGSYSGGTAVELTVLAAGGGYGGGKWSDKEIDELDGQRPEGFGGQFSEGQFPENGGQRPDRTPPEGFNGELPEGTPPEGFNGELPEGTPPEGFGGELPEGTPPDGFGGEIPDGAPADGVDSNLPEQTA